MRRIVFAALALLLVGGPSEQKEPLWLPPLAEGVPIDCPDHVGTRIARSEVVSAFGSIAFISRMARRGSRGCEYSTKLELLWKGKHAAFPLSSSGGGQFSIADFSPDGQSLLLSRDVERDPPEPDYRDNEVAIARLSGGEMHWVNAWDLLGWGDCDATVEAQGFLNDGRVVFRPQPATWAEHLHPNCVTTALLLAVDLKLGKPRELPYDTKIDRCGQEIHPAHQACRSDPDIIAPCFIVHGRLSVWNETPTLRIWRIGTKRILGVHEDIPLPESVATHINGYDDQVYADFTVCPFTKEQPGAMQMVCVESARNILSKKTR